MFVSHIFATSATLPPQPPGLYQYVVGANGIFVRAERPELAAQICIAPTFDEVRGLEPLTAYARIRRRVPAWMLARMFEMAYRAGNREILFYLSLTGGENTRWRVQLPDQVQQGASVRPVDPYAGGADTVIEVHSHHKMQAFFSSTDDREERTGFRVYAVLGDLGGEPEILARVGIHGHFMNIPAGWVFELPGFTRDAAAATGRLARRQEEETDVYPENR